MNIQTTLVNGEDLPNAVQSELLTLLSQLKAAMPSESLKSFSYKCAHRPPHVTEDERAKLEKMSADEVTKFWAGRKPLSFEYAWTNHEIAWTSQVVFDRDDMANPWFEDKGNRYKRQHVAVHWKLRDLCVSLSGEVDLIAVEW